MKHMTSIAFLLIVSTAHLLAEEPCLGDFVTVTNLWYEGHKTNVLAIAEQRLAANSNDLAGLILKMEYNLAFSNNSCLSNDALLVISVANDMTNEHIKAHSQVMRSYLEMFLDYLAHDYHPTESEIELEKQKGFIIHKPMTYEIPLKALHDDGLF